MTDIVKKAFEFASKAHEGQFRWDGETPYIEHPKKVVALLKSWGVTNSNILAAAYLHDVVEDTYVTRKDILLEFGVNIQSIVTALTREKHEDYITHCERMSASPAIIKIADIISNLSDHQSEKSMSFVRKRLRALRILAEIVE